MSDSIVKIFNANPWKQNISDCVIRAIVMAIGMKYELVCKELGVAWKRGRGLIRDTGIYLDDIKRVFDPYFDKVEDYNEELPPELVDDSAFADMMRIDMELGVAENESGITLAEFLDLYAGQGVFLVNLVGNPAAKNVNLRRDADAHIVCAKCLPGRQGFAIDTFDSSEMIVDAYMRVKAPVPRSDPRHWVYDKERHCFAGYGMENWRG